MSKELMELCAVHTPMRVTTMPK